MHKKIAFVDGNRAINENNVEKHVESLKEFGKNLVPLLYVDATEVGNRKIYDAITDEEVKQEQYGDYDVVLNGQHRYKAALKLVDSDEADGFTLLKDTGGKSYWRAELEKIKSLTDRQRKSFESTPVSKLKEKLEKMLSVI